MWGMAMARWLLPRRMGMTGRMRMMMTVMRKGMMGRVGEGAAAVVVGTGGGGGG